MTAWREPTQARGQDRRDALVLAAAELLERDGISAVTHRTVARAAGVSPGATTYYFASLDDLLAPATRVVVSRWVEQSEQLVEKQAALRRAGSRRGRLSPARLVTHVLLPATDDAVLHQYELLMAVARHPAVAIVVRELRPQIDAVVAKALELDRTSETLDPALAVAVVDGAVVGALTEGHDDVREYVERTVAALLHLIAKV